MQKHLLLFIGAVAVGYFMAGTLVAHQPWKLANSLAGNL